MASINDVFGSGKSLAAKDLEGKGRVAVVIESVEPKKFDDGTKLIIRFVGKEKSLVCNKTNAKAIARQHGEDYTGWPGKRIELWQTTTEYAGEIVPCIRVFVEEEAPPPPSDEECPF